MTGHIYPLHQQFTLLFVHRVCQKADLKKLIYYPSAPTVHLTVHIFKMPE